MKELIKLATDKGFKSELNEMLFSYATSENYDLRIYLWMCELQKWLRDEYNIDVWAQPYVYRDTLSYWSYVYEDGVFKKDTIDCLDSEQALQEGLKQALKLI